jgi:tetratricopeptide (TPR) repeat protein
MSKAPNRSSLRIMNKKDWIYIGVFVAVLVSAISIFGIKKESDTQVDPIDIGENATTTEEGEVSENAPKEYFDLLSDARDLVREKKYNEALLKAGEALDIYDGFQAYATISSIHDFTGDIAAKRDALYEVIYTFGNLESKYWRSYLDTLIQTDIDSGVVRSVYEEGIERIRIVSEAIGMNHLIDMYTGYASYLGGNSYYQEAINYLNKALEIDPSRSEIYNSEIEGLQDKL